MNTQNPSPENAETTAKLDQTSAPAQLDQAGQVNQAGQVDQAGQIDQAGQLPETDPLDDSPVIAEVFGDSEKLIRMFHEKLVQEGVLRGMIGPKEVSRLWERHLLNSAALAPFLRDFATEKHIAHLRVADVGSGAGFPGLVLAAMLPEHYFTLVEPMERRCEWLNENIDMMGLKNARVLRARAEQLHGEAEFDVVTCRAVARMSKLAGWVMPLVHRGGRFIALKGQAAQDEIDSAKAQIRQYRGAFAHVDLAPVAQGVEPTHVVSITKR